MTTLYALVPPYWVEAYKDTAYVSAVYALYTSYEKAEAAQAAIATVHEYYADKCTIQAVVVDPPNEDVIAAYYED